MTERVLITGGAGFIGAHLARRLLVEGDEVRVLDDLVEQVHGSATRPDYLDVDVELMCGDVRDADSVSRALEGVDRVVHLAARVGVGQSMYDIADYVSVNTQGTAVLLEALIAHPVQRLVVASSMSIYGEGLYVDATGEVRDPRERDKAQLSDRCWDPGDHDGRQLFPAPTPEWKSPSLSSVYALSKYDQERLCLMIGDAYAIPTVALRFFNVYGPHQALSNPYTGVLAIFASRLLNDRRPMIFEDGEQRRDFVSVHDIVTACSLALHTESAGGHVLNIGSGNSLSVNEVAQRLARTLGKEHLVPEITNKFRVGDIRHCFADISRAEEVLGYRPSVTIDDGIGELAEWLDGQVALDGVDEATKELESRGLAV
jgi:dTDP-L-rhamnose 4-epimerase